MRPPIGSTALVLAFAALSLQAADPAPVYLADAPGLIVNQTQAWGELGINTAAHAPGLTGQPLRIGDNAYAKGLGHHAGGKIWIALDGAYAWFDASVGLQPCGGGGSVAFRVLVDGEARFESDVLRAADAPRAVHVNVAGAQELVLESTDGGDGITCDVANWAEARLVPSIPPPTARAMTQVDMAPFAEVITGDPERVDGCRSGRLEEFRAEDLTLDVVLAPDREGRHVTRPNAGGEACIGLKWFNTRSLRELRLRLDPGVMPEPSALRVQGWFGESAWQGRWKVLEGVVSWDSGEFVFRPELAPSRPGVLQTRKIRWIVPGVKGQLRVARLSAFTRSRWDEVEVIAEVEPAIRGRHAEWRVFNGENLQIDPAGARTVAPGGWQRWDLSKPFRVKVRYARTAGFQGDDTLLQFRMPEGGVGVRIADLLAGDGVYIPDRGLFVTRAATGLSMKDYRAKIAGRKGILQEVREHPEQTLAQAMSVTHHAAQEEGPVMLSLSCANRKFVVEREGHVQFPGAQLVGEDWQAAAASMRVEFGDGKRDRFDRHLEGGWLPLPVMTTERGGLTLVERAFAAPDGGEGAAPASGAPSVCVVEFTIRNLRQEPGHAQMTLRFSPAKGAAPVLLAAEASSGVSGGVGPTLISIVGEPDSPLRVSLESGTATWAGTLPPRGSARVAVFLRERQGGTPVLADADRFQGAMASHWRSALASAMQIETPDVRLNDIIRSSRVRCLIAARNEDDGRRVAAWIAAMSYGPLESEAHSVIRGMDFMGHHEFARRALDFFVHRYNTNGFLTTGYTTFGTAWHLWTLGEHLSLTADRAWLLKVGPELGRVGDWIVRQCDKTRRADARGKPLPGAGLMPPGVMADWNSFAVHFMMNAYYHAALRELGGALRGIDDRRAAIFRKRAEALRRDLIAAYRWTQDQSPALPLRDGTWIPHYPSQLNSPGPLGAFFPGDDAGRAWAYDVELGAHQLVPTGVLAPGHPEVNRIMEHMEDVHFLGEGWFDYSAAANARDWFNQGGFAKVQPFYARNVEIDAMRDDVKPFLRSYFNSLASLLNTEVLTFWEHFRHSGAWDKTHETGYFLHQTRLMLVQERGTELWLAPFIPGAWLEGDGPLAVRAAPTRFGPVSYRIEPRLKEGFIDAWVTPPLRARPSALVLRLRNPGGRELRGVEVDGRRWTSFQRETGVIRLKSGADPIHVRAAY